MSARDPEVNGDPIDPIIQLFVETVIAVVVGCVVLCCVGLVLQLGFGVKF